MEDKDIDKSSSDYEITQKIHLVKKILNNVFEILILFRPIIDQMKISDEFKQYYKNGTLEKVASLFGEISNQSKKIAGFHLSEEFLSNLKN
ncbi:MAG: hypothetical protein ACFFAH_09065 [Promethearchaeota archaeon]